MLELRTEELRDSKERSRMLTYAHVCSRMLKLRTEELHDSKESSRMLTYADVC
jgi:hypothetical protein